MKESLLQWFESLTAQKKSLLVKAGIASVFLPAALVLFYSESRSTSPVARQPAAIAPITTDLEEVSTSVFGQTKESIAENQEQIQVLQERLATLQAQLQEQQQQGVAPKKSSFKLAKKTKPEEGMPVQQQQLHIPTNFDHSFHSTSITHSTHLRSRL